jgi:hypothetical protein
MINCENDNLLVLDDSKNVVYDVCAVKKARTDVLYLVKEAKYLILRSVIKGTGSISGSVDFNFYDTSSEVTQVTELIKTTTLKPTTEEKAQILPRSFNFIQLKF